MNSREGADLTKMAVGCMLLTLLIGAIIGMWFKAENAETKALQHMEKAVTTATADNLFDLTQYTANDSSGEPRNLVPVPTAVSAVTEFSEGDLLYVRVVTADGSLDEIYIPQNLAASGSIAFSNADNAVIKEDVIRYTNAACKRLLQYSKSYCQVIAQAIEDGGYNSIGVVTSDTKMMGVTIVIYGGDK